MYRDNVADFCMAPEDIHEDYIASAKAIVISGTALAQSPSERGLSQSDDACKEKQYKNYF